LCQVALRAVVVPREIALLFRSFRYLTDFDLLIVSGGGQLLDYWSGAFFQPYALLKWALLARMRGTQFMFVSVGAGPIDARLSWLFIKWALSFASYRSYRDEDSRRLIEGMGFHRDDPVYPDLAFSLHVAESARTRVSTSPKPVVGLNAMTYFDPRVWPERDIEVYKAYVTKLAEFAIWLVRRGHKIILFPGESVHDQWVIEDLTTLLAKELDEVEMRGVAHPEVATVDELIALLSETDIVVGSRFHSVVLAQLLHKPALALTYHPKAEAAMADAGQSRYCIRIGECDVEQLKERFEALEADAPRVTEQLKERTRECKRALEEQYTRLFVHRWEGASQSARATVTHAGGCGPESA
jgi:polysaccharide pyruvyl transferase WcaK-like protein